MIDAYLDESGIHDGAAICVIGGFFGAVDSGGNSKKSWPKILAKHGLKLADFHAKDLIKSAKYEPLLTELTKAILRTTKSAPLAFGVVVEDFNSFSIVQRRFLTGAIVKDRRLLTTGWGKFHGKK